MDLMKVEEALKKIEPGLSKYLYIMGRLNETDVTSDSEFQLRFNGFYRVRQRKPEFYKEYYSFMEEHKSNEVSFDLVLNHFYNKFERVEASFSSKMAATINPNLPVWDEFVLKNLGLKKPSYGSSNRINKTIELYNNILGWYNEFLLTKDATDMLELFDNRYKNVNITPTKKIDLILWQMR